MRLWTELQEAPAVESGTLNHSHRGERPCTCERRLFSDICSSVYEGSPGNYLVAYSALNARTGARLLGVDSGGKVAFDFAYSSDACDTVFIAQPLGWSGLRLR